MEYRIKRGDRRWTPSSLQIITKFNKLTFLTEPNWTMMFNYDYLIDGQKVTDADWRDWKKVSGISLVNWKNPQNIFVKNNDSIMLGWRWNPELHLFEFCLYVNEKGKNIPYERADQILRVKPSVKNVDGVMQPTGQFPQIVFEIETINSKTYGVKLYSLEENKKGINRIVVKTRQRFNLYSRVNPWYGGANNAPGPWGGKAPRDMRMDIYVSKT